MSTPVMIETVHGERVPRDQLAHIAEHFWPFAINPKRLKPDPDNAREHGETDLKGIVASLKAFGQQDVIQFDPATFTVKVGSGRLLAAVAMKWPWIAAVGSKLPADKLRAFALAHNRTAELSRWNAEKLKSELAALEELGVLEELPPLEDLGLGDDGLAELDDLNAYRAGKESVAVDEKDVDTEAQQSFKIVITVGSKRRQLQLLAALEKLDVKALAKMLRGADVRMPSKK